MTKCTDILGEAGLHEGHGGEGGAGAAVALTLDRGDEAGRHGAVGGGHRGPAQPVAVKQTLGLLHINSVDILGYVDICRQ